MFAGILQAKAKKYSASCGKKSFLPKLKCKRRMQQMVNAVRFMALARQRAGDFSEQDREEMKVAFEEARNSIAATLDGGDSAKTVQDKILSSGAMKANPEGTVKRMVDLVMQATEGKEEEREKAKEVIERADDDAFEPIEEKSSIETPESEETEDEFDDILLEVNAELDQMERDDDEKMVKDEDLQQWLDELDQMENTEKTDDVQQWLDEMGDFDFDEKDETEKKTSVLQVRNSMQVEKSKVAGALLAVLAVGATVLTVVAIAQALAFALIGYALVVLVGCFGYYAGRYDASNEVEKVEDSKAVTKAPSKAMTRWQALKGFGKCFVRRVLFPFKLIYRFGKWSYEALFKRNATNTTKS